MTDLDLDALEAVARASTHQESWKVTDLRDAPDGHRDCIWIDTDDVATYATVAEMNDEDGLFPLWGIEDATHIAAFDPPTVLALIERVERAEAERDSAVKEMHARELHHFEEEKLRAGAEARIAAAWQVGAEHGAKRCMFARDGDPCPDNPYLTQESESTNE